MSFLTSTWSYLPFANFKVDPQFLIPHLPSGTQLDLFNGDAYMSLVGLRFENTRILNVPIPFHINFSEINLRFYVKEKRSGKRGVVFIKEIVDKPIITWVANNLYHERYDTMPVNFKLSHDQKNNHEVTYSWKPQSWQQFTVCYNPDALDITSGSKEQFILERYYGYSAYNKQKTFEYEVCHASWKHFEVLSHDIKVDFKETYGADFEFLNSIEPDSIMMAYGSRVSIENKRAI